MLRNIVVLTIVVVSALTTTMPIPRITDDNDCSFQLRVVQWNTEFWDTGENNSEMFNFLLRYDADIYLLQEHGTPTGEDDITGITDMTDISSHFPNYYYSSHHDLLTLSKYPVEEEDRDANRSVLSTLIATPYGDIWLLNVHIIAPYQLSHSPLTREFWNNLGKRDYLQRQQLSWLSRRSVDLESPIIIAGDFNSTSNMRNLSDIFPRHVSLYPYPWQGTWGIGGITPWRLDWQFGSQNIKVVSSELSEFVNFSDHRATRLDVCWSN